MKTTKFIVNGRYFDTEIEAEDYCVKKHFRIQKVETIATKKGTRYLYYVASIDKEIQNLYESNFL